MGHELGTLMVPVGELGGLASYCSPPAGMEMVKGLIPVSPFAADFSLVGETREEGGENSYSGSATKDWK